MSPLTESGLATVRTMPSPCTGSVPLTISSSCIVWFRDQLAKDSDSDSICDRKSLTSLVRSPTRFVCSVSWLANCLRTSLRGSVLSWRTKTLPAAPTAMQMRNTRILVAQIETAERFLVARRESEYRTSIGRLVKSSISRSESSSTCLWRCGMAGMEAALALRSAGSAGKNGTMLCGYVLRGNGEQRETWSIGLHICVNPCCLYRSSTVGCLGACRCTLQANTVQRPRFRWQDRIDAVYPQRSWTRCRRRSTRRWR